MTEPKENKTNIYEIQYEDFFDGNVLQTTFLCENSSDYNKNILFRNKIEKSRSTKLINQELLEDFAPSIKGLLV